MSSQRGTGGQNSLQCAACNFNLTGLPKRGRCPECGVLFDASTRARFVSRPPFGHLLLAIPPLLLLLALGLAYVMFFSAGLCVLLLTPFVCLGLCILISKRLADWRYSIALRESAPLPTPPSRRSFCAVRIAFYMAVQLVGCVGSFEAYRFLLGWLIDHRVLPPGWS